MMNYRYKLNLRDLGGIAIGDRDCVPSGKWLRSGKLSVLTPEQCETLCRMYDIRCVVDLRTEVEVAEFPDPLPQGVEYINMPLFEGATVGISHETGSEPMTIIRRLRKQPEQLQSMVPDFEDLYRRMVTDPKSRQQIKIIVDLLQKNAKDGRCTLFHCTAGKDRTGIVSMALLRRLGVADRDIVKDYMRTNRNAFLPALGKSLGVFTMTGNWRMAAVVCKAYMADRRLIETAMQEYR